MSDERPDWSDDALLKPWRRGEVKLPFVVTERSETETQMRVILTAVITGVVVSFATFGVLVWFGMFPEIYRHPTITHSGDRSVLPWVILGTGGASALVLLGLLSPFMLGSPPGTGHPWTFDAREEGFSITNKRGEVFAGPWEAWTLSRYGTMSMPRGGVVITEVYLMLNGVEHPVRLADQRRQRQFLRLVAQKIAV